MKQVELYVGQQRLQLGRLIGKGGEGAVYSLANDPTLAVKLYTLADLAAREAKVAAMVAAGLGKEPSLVAFPVSVVHTTNSRFAGFVMRLLGQHKPLHELYSPGSRKLHFPQADYRFLVRTATNVARAVAAVHRAGCVIGDINHSGILVSPKATVALIDADSFQFSTNGKIHRCVVGVPEYTPPELQGRRLDTVVRTPNHDAFGLAVVVFQLLFMGRHPFVGTVRAGETPPLDEAIRDHRYVYDDRRDVGMDQPPGTPALDRFYQPIAAAFDEAFDRKTRDLRPTAEFWVHVLSALERDLVQCDDNSLHYIPRHAAECAWCELEKQTGAVLFLPHVPAGTLVDGSFDPGARGFDVGAIWKAIEAIQIPTLPQAAISAAPSPSSDAVAARRAPRLPFVIRGVAVGAAIILTALFPDGWFIWLGAPWIAWANSPIDVVVDGTAFKSRCQAAEQKLHAIFENTRRQAELERCQTLKAELAEACAAYRSLTNDERQQLEQYRRQRRDRQLHAYLDRFAIRDAKIRGIGPAKQAALASFGVDTAADVEHLRISRIPRFGSANTSALLQWRAVLESRFVFVEVETEFDRQERAKIRVKIESRASGLRKTLTAGAQNLSVLVARSRAVIEQGRAAFSHASEEYAQAVADLQFLGLPLPPPPVFQMTAIQSASSSSSSIVGGGAGSPSCPRCGGSMVKRTARRGQNAGGQFWGCLRYPTCKGTRNI